MIRGLSQAVRKQAKSGDINILQNMKNMSWGQKANIAGTTVAGVMGYSEARNEGHGVVGSLAKGATDAFLIDLIGWKAYIGGSLLMGVPKLAAQGYESMSMKAREMSRAGSQSPFAGNTFVDSEQIYTMRQAGMSMIEQSRMSTKTALLGNEAQFMHR